MVGVSSAQLNKESKSRQASSSKGESRSAALSSREINTLLDLQIALLEDVSEVVNYDCTMDILTIQKRFRQEGFQFLSKTLSKFCGDFFTSLKTGFFCSTIFRMKYKKGCRLALPSFLFGLTRQVFDEKTGVVLPEPSVDAVKAIRQVTLFLKKYTVPFSAAFQDASLRELISIDKGLPNGLDLVLSGQQDLWSKVVLVEAQKLLEELFHQFDVEAIMPKHGPGAVQEGVEQHEKFQFPRYSRALHSFYPMDVYTSPSLGQARHECEGMSKVLRGSYYKDLQYYPTWEGEREDGEFEGRCSRVAQVPKDSGSLRVIFIEPTGNQWIQGGLARSLMKFLEGNRLTAGRVNFSNQSINQALALEGSRTGLYATVDWSKASDRISRALVRALFPFNIFQAFQSCSSLYLELKWSNGNRSYVKQRKFASMGNGTCFPVESLVFWALSVAAIKMRGAARDDALDAVWVYGDDLIIKSEYVNDVLDILPKYGLMFNEAKSFTVGPFRESCGVDAFLGNDITPLKLKTRMPNGRKDVDGLTGWLDFLHSAIDAGYGRLASLMLARVEKALGDELPVTPYKTNLLSLISPELYSPDLHTEERSRQIDKVKGDGFAMIQQLPFYQGTYIRGWAVKAKTYQPSEKEFSERNAMMRYFSSRPELEKQTNKYESRHHIDAMISAGSARVFAFPHRSTINRSYTIVT